MFLKIAAQTFEARDILNIFFKFWYLRHLWLIFLETFFLLKNVHYISCHFKLLKCLEQVYPSQNLQTIQLILLTFNIC